MQLNIVSLDRTTETGIITTAHWTASKTDGEYTASSYGSVGLNPPTGIVIPYLDVTKEEAIAWTECKLDMTELEASLDTQLVALKNPPVSTGLPWVS
jgi:hypothetical protein